MSRKQEYNPIPDKDNYPEYVEKKYEFNVPAGQSLVRLDRYLTNNIINATRNKVQKAIEEGNVLVNGRAAKKNRKIHPGDVVICSIMKPPPIELVPESIPLDIKYEDDSLLVINKPPGMCTHPGFGNRYGTLVNAVLFYLGYRENIPVEYNELNDAIDNDAIDNDAIDNDAIDNDAIDNDAIDNDAIDNDEEGHQGNIFAGDGIRPGVVHRLDKDTSGLLVISKSPEVTAIMQAQFADRSISRQYLAIVWGDVKNDSGIIEGDIGRSARDRKLFAIVRRGGKHAITEYSVVERFGLFTLLKLKLQTGRTHQIRVHCTSINHPVLGDQFYGGDKVAYSGQDPYKRKLASDCLAIAHRQLLHAKSIEFIHPVSKGKVAVGSELPADMQSVLQLLDESLK